MTEQSVVENSGLLIKIILILIGLIQALGFLLWRAMGMRVGRAEDAIDTCFKKNDQTFVPRPEYEATIKAMNERGNRMDTNIQKLVDRSYTNRKED